MKDVTVTDAPLLAEQFEAHRTHLRSVAYRMLGTLAEADDAVQESWIRLSRAGTDDVENMGGWMTTIVARVCLDMLRSRKSRREEALEIASSSHIADTSNPEHEAVLADSVGHAMLVVLETLTPAERLAFVLHDMFAVSFEQIAAIIDRTSTAARQLASRARRRVQGAPATASPDLQRQRTIVDAFLLASREGKFGELLALLDPDVIVRADEVAARMGSPTDLNGSDAVARFFNGAASTAQPTIVEGIAGAAWAPNGRIAVLFDIFVNESGKIVEIEFIADRAHLTHLDVAIVES